MIRTEIVEQRDNWVKVFSPAKVNLFLQVGAAPSGQKRHSLLTVFQALELGEELILRPIKPDSTVIKSFSTINSNGQISKTNGTEIKAAVRQGDEVCSIPAAGITVPSDLDGPDNLVRRALAHLRTYTGVDFPATSVSVRKQIPVAGGMAGGSADAAGTLWGANALYQLGLNRAELINIAGELGADVPFALQGGAAMGTRFGDLLSPILNVRKNWWVLAINKRGLSTPAVFQEYDRLHPDAVQLAPMSLPTEILQGLQNADATALAQLLRNDLAEPAFSLRPELAQIVAAAEAAGALRAMVSGSGPTIAALCRNREQAEKVSAVLAKREEIESTVISRG